MLCSQPLVTDGKLPTTFLPVILVCNCTRIGDGWQVSLTGTLPYYVNNYPTSFYPAHFLLYWKTVGFLISYLMLPIRQ
jgi:hypothetical protein